jgi:hypothetical protein
MNANDTLKEYTCTENYYKYNFGMLLTDGALQLAKTYGAFWFLEVIVSYQSQLKTEEFQVWTLTRYDDDSCLIRCTDGNGRQLKSQEIDYTDFICATATLWVEKNIILLPSEH